MKKHELSNGYYLTVSQKKEDGQKAVNVYDGCYTMPVFGSRFSASYSLEDLKEWAETLPAALNAEIIDLLTRFDATDIFEAMVKHGNAYVVDDIAENIQMREGMIMVKPQTQKEHGLLMESINTIYPSVNAQQQVLLIN